MDTDQTPEARWIKTMKGEEAERKRGARQPVTFYHHAKHVGLYLFGLTRLSDNFKESSDIFMLHFRNTTLMAVWQMFRTPGQPRSHERDIRDGDTWDGSLKTVPTACAW